MLGRIYGILAFALIIVYAIYKLFDSELKRVKDNRYSNQEKSRYEKVIEKICYIFKCILVFLFIAFCICNILVIFLYESIPIKVLGISFAILTIFKIIVKYIDNFEYLSLIILVVAMIIYAFLFLFVVIFPTFTISGEAYSQYSHTISILEMKEVPYANVHGGHCYIRTSPSLAYYYDISTEKGSTTKVIDGYNHYVEKIESDEYLGNPHIDVYHTICKDETFFYGEISRKTGTSYYIYVPENGILYDMYEE